MRIAKSWREAQENRRHEIVLTIPSVWTWTWRVGATFVLMAVWLGSELDPVIGNLGAWIMMIALFGPIIVKYLQAWGTMLRGPNQRPEASE